MKRAVVVCARPSLFEWSEIDGNGKTTFALPNLKKAAPNGLTYSICEFNSVYP